MHIDIRMAMVMCRFELLNKVTVNLGPDLMQYFRYTCVVCDFRITGIRLLLALAADLI